MKLKRWLSAALTLAMTAALALPVHAADPLAGSFAAFLIDSEIKDFPHQSLHVELYRRDNSGAFQKDDAVRYSCDVNRVAGDAAFFIQPKADQVWVDVDYLTDLNRDGIYEMLDGETDPVSDVMTAEGTLIPRDGQPHLLTGGQSYLLSADTLRQRAAEVLQARRTSGSGQTLPASGKELPSVDTVLYFVTLHYFSQDDQQEYSLGYYLKIFDSVIVPSDVVPGSWYYDAVEYALEQGFLSGTGADSFSPGGMVNRSQLAQILWRLGGSQQAADPGFSDVAEKDWFYKAVAWCCQEGLMSSSDGRFSPNGALTREQLALILQKFTQLLGLSTDEGQDLSSFRDGDKVSSWARPGVEWAVANGLLSGGSDGALRPGSGITRCELAVVLRTFCQTVLER